MKKDSQKKTLTSNKNKKKSTGAKIGQTKDEAFFPDPEWLAAQITVALVIPKIENDAYQVLKSETFVTAIHKILKEWFMDYKEGSIKIEEISGTGIMCQFKTCSQTDSADYEGNLMLDGFWMHQEEPAFVVEKVSLIDGDLEKMFMPSRYRKLTAPNSIKRRPRLSHVTTSLSLKAAKKIYGRNFKLKK